VTIQTLISKYIAFKRSSGADFRAGEKLLGTFARLIGPEVDVAAIGRDQVAKFIQGDGRATFYVHRKYYALREFYAFATSRGHAAEIALPTTLPRNPPALEPYIYSRQEIRRLLDGASGYRKQGLHLEPETFCTILILLYGAGLRISEATGLTRADVDLKNTILTVRETKFYKTRLVPVGAGLSGELERYRSRTEAFHGSRSENQAFFVDRKGKQLLISTIREAFTELRGRVGISRADGGRYQPRLHDLRHSFAVHRLTSWYAEGADVQSMLPRLSTYLGHHSLAATQKYLTMTPDLLLQASRRFEKYAFPEVMHG
jgi:integrase/recombinase XerD